MTRLMLLLSWEKGYDHSTHHLNPARMRSASSPDRPAFFTMAASTSLWADASSKLDPYHGGMLLSYVPFGGTTAQELGRKRTPHDGGLPVLQRCHGIQA